MSEGVVWIVDDDRSIRWVLERALVGAGLEARSFESADSLIDAIGSASPNVVVTDIRMPGRDGFELLDYLNNGYPKLPVIVMTAFSDLDRAVSAFRGGAFEYLPKPFDIDQAVAIVQRAVRSCAENQDSATASERRPAGYRRWIAGRCRRSFRAIGRLSQFEHDRAGNRRVGYRQGTGCARPARAQSRVKGRRSSR